MRKALSSLFLIISLFVFIGLEPADAVENDINRKLVINQEEVIEGPLFKAAESIHLSGQVDGDVILIAGEVIVDAIITGDLIIVGGQVNVSGSVLDDVRIVAGQVDLNADVAGDVSIAAGQVTFQQDSKIGNHLLVASGITDYTGLVNKNIWIYSGRTRFNGQSNQNVFLTADNVDVYSDTNINGNLSITYGEKPVISNRAQISGDLIEEKSATLTGNKSIKDFKIERPAVQKFTTLMIIQNLTVLSINILIGWLILRLVPGLTQKLIKIGQTQAGSAVGWGLLTILLVPVIGMILIISLIGIPFGVITFMYYGVSLYFARLTAGLVIGTRLLKNTKSKTPYKSFALGMLILAILKLIPVLGWLVYFLAVLFGLGTLTLHEKSALAKLKKKK